MLRRTMSYRDLEDSFYQGVITNTVLVRATNINTTDSWTDSELSGTSTSTGIPDTPTLIENFGELAGDFPPWYRCEALVCRRRQT